MEFDARLRSLRTLIQDLQNTREPSRLSLATSLDTIVSSITNVQGQLTHISDYGAKMYEYYRIVECSTHPKSSVTISFWVPLCFLPLIVFTLV
jgi:hypothetical protein